MGGNKGFNCFLIFKMPLRLQAILLFVLVYSFVILILILLSFTLFVVVVVDVVLSKYLFFLRVERINSSHDTYLFKVIVLLKFICFILLKKNVKIIKCYIVVYCVLNFINFIIKFLKKKHISRILYIKSFTASRKHICEKNSIMLLLLMDVFPWC